MNCHQAARAAGALLALSLALAPAWSRAQDLAPTADATLVEPADLGEPVGIQPSTTPSRFACGLAGGPAGRGAAPGLIPLSLLVLVAARRRRRGRS
jgi:hypothetical protein